MTALSSLALIAILLLLIVRYQKALNQLLLRKNTISSQHESQPSASDLKHMKPYPAQPIKGRERYRVMMDIRKMDILNWLTIDNNYLTEHRVRSQLLDEKKDQVLQCLPASLAACQETLQEVSGFLCGQFPGMFEKSTDDAGAIIMNCVTGETFAVDEKDPQHWSGALEAAVRLTMEDLSILMKNDDDEYYLYVAVYYKVMFQLN